MAKVQVKVSDALSAEFGRAMQTVMYQVDEVLASAADQVADEARNSPAFRDYKGTDREPRSSAKRWSRNAARLRRKIKAQKSKFEGGGYIVVARAPHAHLVEFGHAQVMGGKRKARRDRKTKQLIPAGTVIGHVAPRPFLRPALDKVLAMLTAKLKGATSGQN